MMIFKKAYAFVLFAALFSQTVFAQESTHTIYKSDGSSSSYRFLPVKYDPAHKSIVELRLRQKKIDISAIPASYQISTSKLPQIRDQGSRGTCAYFSTVGLMEAYYMKKSSSYKDIRLSEECLANVRNWMFDQGRNYTGADKPRQRPDPNGDFPSSIVRTIKSTGVPFAKQYAQANCNYQSSYGSTISLNYYKSIFPEGQTPAFGKGVNFDVNVNPTVETVKNLIARDIPVEVAIFIYKAYESTSDWRYDPRTNRPSTMVGGHAIQLVGYKTSGTKTIFTVKNSWGRGWGESGYGTIDDAILTHSWSYDRNFDFIVSMHD